LDLASEARYQTHNIVVIDEGEAKSTNSNRVARYPALARYRFTIFILETFSGFQICPSERPKVVFGIAFRFQLFAPVEGRVLIKLSCEPLYFLEFLDKSDTGGIPKRFATVQGELLHLRLHELIEFGFRL